MLPVAILAGGLATRLQPVTRTIPKSMVQVAGRPFLFHQLDWLRTEGVERVVLCLGHLGEEIRAAVGDGKDFGLAVDYAFDGERLLGTGGALRAAMPKLGEIFFVLYGDSYLQCSLSDVEKVFRASAKLALMTVFRNEGQWDRSNILFSEGRLLRHDKRHPTSAMRHIDYGLSIVCAQVLASYEEGRSFDLADALSTLAERGKLAGFEVSERFYEIGSPAGLKETEEFLYRRGRDAL